jgi:hypothetical protein
MITLHSFSMTLHRSFFETTIRYVGGLLSAYELSGEKFPILVEKAKEVADGLINAWVGVSITCHGWGPLKLNEHI